MMRRELALKRAAQLKSSDIGGHMQSTILYRLASSPATMGELADFALADKASTTRTVASLEAAGLVKRVAHEGDRRITIIELTSKGKTMAAKAQEMRASMSEWINSTLTVSERKELVRLLSKVVQGLQEHEI